MKRYRWHRFIYSVLRFVAGPFVKSAFAYECARWSGPDRPSLIIANHNANLDPALVGMGFTRHMYFVSSEHALRDGFKSRLLKFVFAPVAINKSHADVSAIKDILRRLKAGASVCLFAEGDRSFYGTTGPIPFSTAKLVKTSGADLITFRIEGGYLTTPRWSNSRRKGHMTGGAVGVYSAAELKSMTNEQVISIIERDIFEDAYERQKVSPVRFRGKDLAEYIETALYLCPVCECIGTIRSHGDRFYCGCGLDAAYTETGLLEGDNFRLSTMTEWGRWQTERLAEIVSQAGDEAICWDLDQKLYIVRAAKGREPAGVGLMQIDRKELRCVDMSFPLSQILRVAVVDRMTLQLTQEDGITYEIESPTPRSALKYKEIFDMIRASRDA